MESSYHGSSLHWESFILLYYLLCGIDNSNCLVSTHLISINKYIHICHALAITTVQKIYQEFLYSGNDSGRIQDIFN